MRFPTQSRRYFLELSGGFVRHPGSGELAQFLIDQREQFVSGLRITLLEGRQDARDIAHGRGGIRFCKAALFRSRTGENAGTKRDPFYWSLGLGA
jgi:hypothetical protein